MLLLVRHLLLEAMHLFLVASSTEREELQLFDLFAHLRPLIQVKAEGVFEHILAFLCNCLSLLSLFGFHFFFPSSVFLSF